MLAARELQVPTVEEEAAVAVAQVVPLVRIAISPALILIHGAPLAPATVTKVAVEAEVVQAAAEEAVVQPAQVPVALSVFFSSIQMPRSKTPLSPPLVEALAEPEAMAAMEAVEATAVTVETVKMTVVPAETEETGAQEGMAAKLAVVPVAQATEFTRAEIRQPSLNS